MRFLAAIFLALGSSSAALAQQAPATAIKLNPATFKTLPGSVLVKPEKSLVDFLAKCPACQTIATPTGTVLLVPGGNGQMTIMQSTANPFGVTCPAGLNVEQTAAMKARLAGLVGTPTVKLLERGTAKEPCPGVAFTLKFAQIVLGDDVSITKVKP